MTDERAAGGGGRARDRVLAVAVVLVAATVVGFVLALVFQWPSDFVLGDEPDTEVTLADVVTGTVTSMPLAPFLVLVVCAALVRSRRAVGTVATVVLTLLGGVFVIGGSGELASDNPEVPRAVLVVAGLLYVLLGLALSASGVAALVDDWWRRTSRRDVRLPGRS